LGFALGKLPVQTCPAIPMSLLNLNRFFDNFYKKGSWFSYLEYLAVLNIDNQ